MWQSAHPRRFGIILEKILDRHERIAESPSSGMGGGGVIVLRQYVNYFEDSMETYINSVIG